MKNWFKKHSKGIELAMDIIAFVMLCALCVVAGIMTASIIYEFTPDPAIPVAHWVLLGLWWLNFFGYRAVKNYNSKHNKRKINTHEAAANIVDEFEELLDVHDITIPDKWREDGEDEARIYGATYDALLENVEAKVIDAIHTVTNEEEVEIISDRF